MSLYNPPSDPFGGAHDCRYCDQPMRKEWPARGADWICDNPQCTNSHNYKGGDKDFIWCRLCETWVNRNELKRWTGDDALHWLCPGCDDDLLPVESLE